MTKVSIWKMRTRGGNAKGQPDLLSAWSFTVTGNSVGPSGRRQRFDDEVSRKAALHTLGARSSEVGKRHVARFLD